MEPQVVHAPIAPFDVAALAASAGGHRVVFAVLRAAGERAMAEVTPCQIHTR